MNFMYGVSHGMYYLLYLVLLGGGCPTPIVKVWRKRLSANPWTMSSLSMIPIEDKYTWNISNLKFGDKVKGPKLF